MEEWVRVRQFIATQSPNKWRMYENLPAEGNLKRQLRQQIVQRYRALQRLEQNDPERHDLESRAIWIEDEIYGVLRDLDAALREGHDSAPVEQALRAKVDELVKNRDKWKARRLQRVARELLSMSGAAARRTWPKPRRRPRTRQPGCSASGPTAGGNGSTTGCGNSNRR
jgi:hypothetical protein